MNRAILSRAFRTGLVIAAVTCLVPLTASAATSDVTFTYDRTALLNPATSQGPGSLFISGAVTCKTTEIPFTFTDATIRQHGVNYPANVLLECNPATGTGTLLAGLSPIPSGVTFHAGPVTVTFTITLSNGVAISSTGTAFIPNLRVPNRTSTRIDDTYFPFGGTCGFPIEARDVGRQTITRFNDPVTGAPKYLIDQFVGKTTYTNLDTGTFVTADVASRVKFSQFVLNPFEELVPTKEIFNGLNYRIRTASGKIVSSGRAILTLGEGETATPHLRHVTDVICGLLG